MKILRLAKKAMSECRKARRLEEKQQRQKEKCDALERKIEALKAQLEEQEYKWELVTNDKLLQYDVARNAIYQAQREFDLNNSDLAENGSEHLRDGWECFKEKNQIDLTY